MRFGPEVQEKIEALPTSPRAGRKMGGGLQKKGGAAWAAPSDRPPIGSSRDSGSNPPRAQLGIASISVLHHSNCRVPLPNPLVVAFLERVPARQHFDLAAEVRGDLEPVWMQAAVSRFPYRKCGTRPGRPRRSDWIRAGTKRRRISEPVDIPGLFSPHLVSRTCRDTSPARPRLPRQETLASAVSFRVSKRDKGRGQGRRLLFSWRSLGLSP